jgi:hypothetical protein
MVTRAYDKQENDSKACLKAWGEREEMQTDK